MKTEVRAMRFNVDDEHDKWALAVVEQVTGRFQFWLLTEGRQPRVRLFHSEELANIAAHNADKEHQEKRKRFSTIPEHPEPIEEEETTA